MSKMINNWDTIDYWNVFIYKKTPDAIISSVNSPNLECSKEPKRIDNYYILKFENGSIKHIMADSLNYIEWKPVYKNNSVVPGNQKGV